MMNNYENSYNFIIKPRFLKQETRLIFLYVKWFSKNVVCDI